ncbi:hypothetical protein LCI18_003702 [Fusarium solani-melongenae]|uniref:Uncharacterized protein n=1 Tax=Fusarium solani subsp. cucurbitae TaxID=2747967 RepID=A0ACD3YV47_FUSSC|nr:hypothetical protein LCI18_003702 [Fusarium solani-melongenae]
MTKLQEAYSLPDVSPFDIDQFGRTTAHLCIMRFGVIVEEASRLLDSLETLLRFLSRSIQVDIFVGEKHNGSILEYLVESGLPSLLPRVYDVQQNKEEHGWDEVLDEDQSSIDELGKLTAEFEQEFLNQEVSLKDFLQNYWLEKMREERKKRKALSEKQKQELCEIGVILDPDYESSSDRYYSDFDEEEEEDMRGGQLDSSNSSKVMAD